MPADRLRVQIPMSRELVGEIDAACERIGVSRGSLVSVLVAQGLRSFGDIPSSPRRSTAEAPSPSTRQDTADAAKPHREGAAVEPKMERVETPEHDPEAAPTQVDFDGWDWGGLLIEFD